MRLVSHAVVPLVLAALSIAGLVAPGTTLAQSPESDEDAGVRWFPNQWVIAARIADASGRSFAPRALR